ncbi:hypothetical protein CPLU01_00978 [Colletotrichum plurivorum]|uniref:Uncharacterized protein n=1 Tax=Colletotrichum plurivorum TaxID=2175906 RepID=A0A8H6NQC0_9PEZI|nr:hypothetical protein CPLU01_00978 [Colletotrichum plurivorum]
MRRGGDCAPSLGVESKPDDYYFPLFISTILFSHWKLQVCTIEPDQIVTKEFLRDKLKQLQPFSQLLCLHVTFEHEFLMRPFGWERCICFRSPSHGGLKLHDPSVHWTTGQDCCACFSCERPENMGRFMMQNSLGYHSVRCGYCRAEYGWLMEGNVVMLNMRRHISDLGVTRVSEYERKGLLEPGWHIIHWFHGLDTATFKGSDELRSYFRQQEKIDQPMNKTKIYAGSSSSIPNKSYSSL